MSSVRLAPPAVDVERRGDDLVLRCPHPMAAPPRALGVYLERWAQRDPDRTLLAERFGDGWQRLSFGAAWDSARRIGAALLRLGGSPTRPLVILSHNSLSHALMQLGAMTVGVPVAPISTAYSLMSTTHERLHQIVATLGPGVAFAEDLVRYGAAVDALPDGVAIVGDGDYGGESTPFAVVADASPSDEADRAWAAVGPDTIAKILFTSGSTGTPKGVVNTQRMLCSNQEAIAALWPFLEGSPPITVDWLPWSHTFGSNHNLGLVLRNGGTLYIDGGRPAPGLLEPTLRNLREVSPTVYFNVPRGYDLLAAAMEQDEGLRRSFFARLDLTFYAAAALPEVTRRRLEALARAEGREVFFASAWGSTETAPLATSAYFPTTTPAVIGLPAPGVEIKLASTLDRYELRVRGPNVTPGTWEAGGTIQPPALDEEGFLRTGDAGSLVDEDDPRQGLRFGGRLGENFKLSTGTWVLVGQLRMALIEACAPWVQDAVLAGHDRDQLTALLFVGPLPPGATEAERRAGILEGLRQHGRAHPASSTRVHRASLELRPPSLDAGETTDKGYLNQRRILELRAETVQRLYAPPYGDDVLVVPLDDDQSRPTT